MSGGLGGVPLRCLGILQRSYMLVCCGTVPENGAAGRGAGCLAPAAVARQGQAAQPCPSCAYLPLHLPLPPHPPLLPSRSTPAGPPPSGHPPSGRPVQAPPTLVGRIAA